MSSHQTQSSRVFATAENGNHNQATCHWQPSPCHSAFRHAVSENQEPACAPLAIDQPAGLTNAPYVMLAEAHQTMFPEPGQLDHSATIMDMILDHRLLISVAALPAAGHHRFTVPRNCALRCRADVDAYWAQEKERGKFVSPTMSKNIEPPVSVEHSAMAWPPRTSTGMTCGIITWFVDLTRHISRGHPVWLGWPAGTNFRDLRCIPGALREIYIDPLA